jgi:hypothetical protein
MAQNPEDSHLKMFQIQEETITSKKYNKTESHIKETGGRRRIYEIYTQRLI